MAKKQPFQLNLTHEYFTILIRMKIILITGYAGSGKDTVGSLLQDKGYKRYGFADVLKLESSRKHNYNFELTQTQTGKSTQVVSQYNGRKATVRDFLISDSFEAKVQNSDPAYFAKILLNQIQSELSEKIVITDWRFIAEYAHFKIINPITLRVIRPNQPILDEPSEHDLDDFTTMHTILNNSTIEHLKNQLNHIL